MVYAAAFVLFGVSDFVEAYRLTSGLLWIKLAILIGLFKLRQTAIRKWYPGSRVY